MGTDMGEAATYAARRLYDYLAQKPWLGSLDPDGSGDLTPTVLVVLHVMQSLEEFRATAPIGAGPLPGNNAANAETKDK
jgi:hypothetical protein